MCIRQAISSIGCLFSITYNQNLGRILETLPKCQILVVKGLVDVDAPP